MTLLKKIFTADMGYQNSLTQMLGAYVNTYLDYNLILIWPHDDSNFSIEILLFK